MAINWTKEQIDAFSDRDKNLLVSASAGSGKTTVMVKRIIDLMLEKQIPITDFLIVTFTKASSGDMKQKLQKKLAEKLEENPNNKFLIKQIENVPISDICDLHSFCAKLISMYFYKVSIDPSFKIIDNLESENLKSKCLTQVFDQKEKMFDEKYFKLFDIFQRKRGRDELEEAVMKLYTQLNSHIDGDAWFFETLEKSYQPNIEKNDCANKIKNYARNRIKNYALKVEKFLKVCLENDCDKMYQHFLDISSKISLCLKEKSYSGLAKQVFEINFERTPTVEKDKKFLSEMAKAIKDPLKKEIINLKENLISFDEELLKIQMNSAKNDVLALFELTKEFDAKFFQAKKDLKVLDFADLEKFALQILSDEDVCTSLKNKYKFVFVDEYQDINNVQETIISKVSGTNNRFMVGDVKQSIYRFRLCDPDIFLEKYKLYQDDGKVSKLIKLNCNFRSDKKILKFVDDIFSNVMTEEFGEIDYNKDALFEAGADNLDNPNAVNLLYVDTTKNREEKSVATNVYSVKNHEQKESSETSKCIAEANLVAEKIDELTSELNPNKIKYEDIAILVFSRNLAVKKFIEVLKLKGVPVSSDEKYNLLEQKPVYEILNFIKYVFCDCDDILLFKVLKSRLFNFSDKQLSEIRKIDLKKRFYELLNMSDYLENEELKQKIAEFLEMKKTYKKLFSTLMIKQSVRLVVDNFKLYEINLLEENGDKFNQDINKLISILPEKSTNEFVLEYENLSLETENDCGGNAVSVMTVHKSKGMEFKAVFVINTSCLINLTSANGSLLMNKFMGVGFDYFNEELRIKNPTIPISAIRMEERRKIVEEQQRVLYVALTRAKEKLFVVCSKEKDKISESFPERPNSYICWFEKTIFNELFEKHNDKINFESFEINDLLDGLKQSSRDLNFTATENNNDAKQFKYDFETSVSIPLKNSISKILKYKKVSENLENEDETFEIFEDDFVPQKKIISYAKKGTAFHKIMEKISFDTSISFEQRFIKALEILDEDQKNLVDKNDVENVLNLDFFKNLGDKKVLREKEFFGFVPANLYDENASDGEKIMLQGVVDLIVFEGDSIAILDYKTGKISDEKLKSYSFQLNTYAYAIEKAYKMKVSRKILCFVGDKKLIEI